jgi:hypothetical protein
MDNTIKKKSGQPSKAVKYPNERLNMARKILKILNITKDNKTLILNNFDVELQQEILDLEKDIKLFFNAGGWAVFKKGKEVEKAYMSITRNVMKEVGITMINSTKYIKGQHLSCYTFEINDNFFE